MLALFAALVFLLATTASRGGLVAAAEKPIAVPGIRVGLVPSSLVRPRISFAMRATAPPTCSREGFECHSDCKTFMVCSTIGAAPDRTSLCADETPFCTNNACAERPAIGNDQCYGTATDTFVCTSAGMFPDPNNCSQYLVCPGAAPAEAVLFRCPEGATYDSEMQTCMRLPAAVRTAAPARPTWCTTTMCPRRFVGNVAYPPNPVFYVFCFEETRMMFRCADEERQVFDAKRNECVHRCTEAGNFADRVDCRRWWTCTRRGSRFEVVHSACPAGQWWAAEGGRCEAEGATACVPEIV